MDSMVAINFFPVDLDFPSPKSVALAAAESAFCSCDAE